MRFLPIATWRFLLGVFASRWESTCEKGGLRLVFQVQKEDILLRGFTINLFSPPPYPPFKFMLPPWHHPVLFISRVRPSARSGGVWLGREARLHLFDNDIKREIIIAIIFSGKEELLGITGERGVCVGKKIPRAQK